MSQMGMEHEQHHIDQGGAGGYHDSNGQWYENQHNVYHTPQHQSPAYEHSGFSFTPMPMEPYGHGGMPPPRTTHQQLQPLVTMTMPQWPSMLTSQSTYVPPMYPPAPVPMAPITTPVSATSTGSARQTPTPRKTLTDLDRRRMCLYAEEHPNVKQTEIGAMFGVERSTVSKVLRQKEKYLYQDDGSRSPARKQKGKFPDIERALTNWIRNQHKQGLPITDAAIKDKARFFATSVGNPESHQKANSSSWLEKFKQKNNILGGKSRKSSLGGDSEGTSNPASGAQTPSGVSPTSPSGIASPAEPATKMEEGIKSEAEDAFAEFTHGHRPFHSASNPSLPSVFGDHTSSSFSPGPTSPTSPFYTPDSATGPSPFIPIQPRDGSGSGFQRPRSQTFPMVGIEPFSPPSSGSLTPKYLSAAALESPLNDIPGGIGSIDGMEPPTAMATPPLPSTIAPSSLPINVLTSQAHSSPITPSSNMSSPVSPTQEDARRALELVMNFFAQQPSGIVEPQEYMTMGKLMEKLKLHSRHSSLISLERKRGVWNGQTTTTAASWSRIHSSLLSLTIGH
ncbi:CenpB-DNA-bind-domain-containing protein [Rhizodiscina lignyota]|uniref:CenpB-DNA-bind-domain-containing protein n=1 Tax=Rhizodiscina lignyota TaxID=1504668 RepID=A0A9P4IQ25_9PEZI|nr:CenpB-DNA-bind-domain-containing protein [Rhizodiscina lignyota]